MRTLTTPPIYLLLYLLLPAICPPVPKRLMTDPIVRLDRFLCPSSGLTGGIYPRRSSVSPQPIAPRPEGCGHSGAAPNTVLPRQQTCERILQCQAQGSCQVRLLDVHNNGQARERDVRQRTYEYFFSNIQ